ncbi:MAG: hypothetical protein DWQ06_14420 [Calditrichaeota bacterium]|nr:MAG: hypothetical protein DWQ06_14420 [Calditrichota bacterium]
MDEQESKRILEESLKNFGKPKEVESNTEEGLEEQSEELLESETQTEKIEIEEVEYEHLTNKKPLFIGIGFVFVVLVGVAIAIFHYGFSDEGLPNSRDIAAKHIDKMMTPQNNTNEIQKEIISEKMLSQENSQSNSITKKETEPKTKAISTKDSYTEEIISLMEIWESSWENSNFDKFINLYSRDFNSDGMNYESWSKKKSRSLRNKGIQVGVSDLKIIKQGNILIVTFIQNYKSKTISDIGKKTMKFKQENGSYKIFSEKWKKIG